MARRAQLITRDVALSVQCPTCEAPAGTKCYNRQGCHIGQGIHLERFQVVDTWNRMPQTSFAAILDEQTTAEPGLGL